MAAPTFQLGLYGPMTSVSLDYFIAGVIFDIDFRKNSEPNLVTAYGPPLITIDNLNPGLAGNVALQIANSHSLESEGIISGLDFLKGLNGRTQVNGIIGGYHSSITMPVNSVAGWFQIPMVSYASTSAKLSEKANYPWFLRTIPPDSIQAAGMWRFIKSAMIPVVTMFYATETYAEGLMTSVTALAAEASESDRVSPVAVTYMATDYDTATALEAIDLGLAGDAKVFLTVMTTDQWIQFMPAGAMRGLNGTDYQIIGSEAMYYLDGYDIPEGYIKFTPVSQGTLYSKFETMWTKMTVDTVSGTAATSRYGLDLWYTAMSEALTPLSDSFFTTDYLPSIGLEVPYLFDAGYSYIAALSDLMNSGKTLDDIIADPTLLLAALKAVSFTGISGEVSFNSDGDRLASYLIENVQSGTVVSAMLYSASTDTISGDGVQWQNGVNSPTIPDNYTTCLAGYYKDTSTLLCNKCTSPLVATADGTSCEACSFGLVASDHDDGTRTCELYPIQLGMYGPLTSVSMDFLAMAVAFDLDFKKNHDSTLAARFGPPLVTMDDLNPNLRIKLQIDNSNSDSEIGVAVGLAFCQGDSGRDQVAGIIGGFHSSISLVVANLATQYKISQVSYGSTSPSLSSKDSYPYFSRTIPPDSIQGQGMWRYIKSFHIPTLTFMYALETYGEGLYGAVNDLANAANEASRISAIGITYMTTYVAATAEEKIDTAITLANKIIFTVMTADQANGFWPVAKSKGILGGDYQIIGSEALTGTIWLNYLPVGYHWFSPINQGALFEDFKTFWSKMLVDDLTGTQATKEYGLDIMLGPLDMDGADVALPTQSLFSTTDNLAMEAPYLFDAGYTFAVAANTLINSGTSPDDINGDAFLAAVRAVNFEGITGKVKLDENGDRLASYYIRNLQTVDGVVSSVAASLFDSDSDTITIVDGQTYSWMDGTYNDTMPSAYTDCLSGYYKDSAYNCQSCGASMVTNSDGTGCESCAFGLVIQEDADSGARSCAYSPVQMGIFGPMTSVNMDFLVAAVAFDLDFRKNHDPDLQARFGPPIVTVDNLHPNLRIKVQIGNSNSDPDEGVATNLEWFQGKNGRAAISCLVGGFHSAISMPVTSLATQFKVPQVSYASTSASLSNKDSYAYFSRTIPPDSVQGMAMWAFLKTYDVPSASVVYAAETYGEGLYNTVSGLASDDGMSYRVVGISITYMTTNYDTEEARAAATKAMSQSGKVIIMIMTMDQAENFVPIATTVGMFTDEWQVLGSEALAYANLPSLPAGYMYFNPESRGTLFDAFSAYWAKLHVADVIGDEAIEYYGIDKWITSLNSSTVGQVTQDMLDATAEDTAMEMPYLFDAGYALVIAANTMMNSGVAPADFDGEEFLNQIREGTFEGISGSVAFDESGDRLAAYYIMNVQEGTSEGRRLATKSAVLVAIYSAVTNEVVAESDQQFYWMTGAFSDTLPSVLTACEAGFYKDSDTLVCVKCTAGMYSAGGDATACVSCPKGQRANAATGASGCVVCEAGTYAESEGSTNCTSCPAGSYASSNQATECTMCAVGYYQEKTGATKCYSCDDNMETQVLGAETVAECKCSEGFFQIDTDSACLACLEGMTCPFGSNMENYYEWHEGGRVGDVPAFPILVESFMSMPDDPLWVYECNVVARCPGGGPGVCGPGLEIVRSCAHCEDGYHWTGTECSKCSEFEGSGVLFPTLPFLLGPPLLCILYKLSRDDADKWGSWRNAIATFGFLLLNHYQVTTLCNTANLQLSSSVVDFLSTYSFAEDPTSIFKADCAGYRSFSSQMILKSLAPILVLLVCIFTYICSHIAKRLLRRDIAFDANRTLNVYFSLMFTFFAGISAMALTLFKCTPNPNKESTLSKDQSIVCYESDWNSLLIVAVFAVCFYIFGFGGLFLRAVIIAPRHFASLTFQRRWKFLFIKFRPDVWWWALIVCGKGVWMNIGFTFFSEGLAQLYWVMSAMGVYCLAVVFFMPWRHRVANWLDIYMHFALMFLCSLLSYYVHTVVDEDTEQTVAAVVIFVNLTPLFVAVFLFAHLVHHHTNAKSLQNRVNIIKKLAPAMVMFANAPEEETLQFMGKLDEWGYFHVISALHVISAEFCGQGYKARLSDGTLKSSSSIGTEKLGSKTNIAGVVII